MNGKHLYICFASLFLTAALVMLVATMPASAFHRGSVLVGDYPGLE
jgi:hypothetical protein